MGGVGAGWGKAGLEEGWWSVGGGGVGRCLAIPQLHYDSMPEYTEIRGGDGWGGLETQASGQSPAHSHNSPPKLYPFTANHTF